MKDSNMDSSVLQVASFMEIAARTAPKTKGEDFIKIKILSGQELENLASAMIKFGKEKKKGNFDRDAAGVIESNALILIGLQNATTVGLNCGACGFENCSALKEARQLDVEFKGPICAYRHVDLGIAIGSAARTAAMFNIDNRVMYRVGAAARDMGLVDWDFVLGIPLSATGKNIFFDRKM